MTQTCECCGHLAMDDDLKCDECGFDLPYLAKFRRAQKWCQLRNGFFFGFGAAVGCCVFAGLAHLAQIVFR